jgi:hypothetical protein
MVSKYYIAVGESASKSYYVTNTYPIIWDTNFNKSKKFTSFPVAKMELEDNFIVIASTVTYTGMKGIYIDEYDGETGKLIERKKFL